MTDNSFDSSAFASMRGDTYQYYYALFLMLKELYGLKSEAIEKKLSVKVEGLDDIELFENGKVYKLVQTKHLTGKSLPDSSEHFWKTIRIWSDHIVNNKISIDGVIFSLVVTVTASPKSILDLLSQHKIDEALQKIEQFILQSRLRSVNKEKKVLTDNQKAFIAFENLGDRKKQLLESIEINLSEPNLEELIINMKDLLNRNIIRTEHLDSFFDDLIKWWNNKIIVNFPEVTIAEIDAKLQDLRDNYCKDSLPVSYEGKDIDLPHDFEEYKFVLQLKQLDYTRQIENAKQDYYKAYRQRSEWIDYISPEDIIDYENKLINEGWKRKHDEICDDFEIEHNILIDDFSDEKILKTLGRKIYKETLECYIPIKPNITAKYIMNGSYHILANENPKPKVYWNPKFIESLTLKGKD